ncbi:replication domain protein [Staphylococcus capitis]|uniref:replication domain protein n=1 Tax=Staphylococcus capitis TaxID=29388 RepID=UPI00211DA6F2|nr:replication domain protein [Staphylococcus capitis]
MISYIFYFATEPKKLNLDDTEEGDLIHTDDDEKADEDGFSIIAMWNWERKNYFIKE